MTGQEIQDRLDAIVVDLQTKGKVQTIFFSGFGQRAECFTAFFDGARRCKCGSISRYSSGC